MVRILGFQKFRGRGHGRITYNLKRCQRRVVYICFNDLRLATRTTPQKNLMVGMANLCLTPRPIDSDSLKCLH